jgi:hypothetical protein
MEIASCLPRFLLIAGEFMTSLPAESPKEQCFAANSTAPVAGKRVPQMETASRQYLPAIPADRGFRESAEPVQVHQYS